MMGPNSVNHHFTHAILSGNVHGNVVVSPRNVVVKRNDGKFVRTDVLPASHEVSLRPGQAITVELPCAAGQHQYCDVAVVQVEVSGPEQDADPTNNQATIFDDIRGR